MDTDIQVIEKWKRNKKEKEKTRKEIKYTSILSMDIDIGNRKMKKWVVHCRSSGAYFNTKQKDSILVSFNYGITKLSNNS